MTEIKKRPWRSSSCNSGKAKADRMILAIYDECRGDMVPVFNQQVILLLFIPTAPANRGAGIAGGDRISHPSRRAARHI
jgi:hypothetical protein